MLLFLSCQAWLDSKDEESNSFGRIQTETDVLLSRSLQTFTSITHSKEFKFKMFPQSTQHQAWHLWWNYLYLNPVNPTSLPVTCQRWICHASPMMLDCDPRITTQRKAFELSLALWSRLAWCDVPHVSFSAHSSRDIGAVLLCSLVCH